MFLSGSFHFITKSSEKTRLAKLTQHFLCLLLKGKVFQSGVHSFSLSSVSLFTFKRSDFVSTLLEPSWCSHLQSLAGVRLLSVLTGFKAFSCGGKSPHPTVSQTAEHSFSWASIQTDMKPVYFGLPYEQRCSSGEEEEGGGSWGRGGPVVEYVIAE